MLVCILILFMMVDMLIVIMMIKLIVMIEIFTLSPEGGRLHPEQGRFISLPDSDYTRATRLHICIVFIISGLLRSGLVLMIIFTFSPLVPAEGLG